MKKVLIAGSTGYLGEHVIKEFKKQGYWIRALARSTSKLEKLSEFIDEIIKCEVTDKNSLGDVCNGIDIVFSSIGITKQKDKLTYMDVDYQGNKNLLEQAIKENVSKFIYISVYNAEKLKKLKGVQAKIKFTDELKKSGLNYLVIYPNGFFSDMLEYLRMAQKGRGYIFGSGEYKINPIHGADLAELCVAAVTREDKEINAGGPDILTHKEILTIAFECLSKTVKISSIPILLKNLLLMTLRTVTSSKTYGPFEFFMTVLSTDMIAPTYGKFHLKQYFLENKDKI